jgi:hypothetical protein
MLERARISNILLATGDISYAEKTRNHRPIKLTGQHNCRGSSYGLFNLEDNRDYIKAPTVQHMNGLQFQATATAACTVLHLASLLSSPSISSDHEKLST